MSETVRVDQGLPEGTRTADGVIRSYKEVPLARSPIGELVAGWSALTVHPMGELDEKEAGHG